MLDGEGERRGIEIRHDFSAGGQRIALRAPELPLPLGELDELRASDVRRVVLQHWTREGPACANLVQEDAAQVFEFLDADSQTLSHGRSPRAHVFVQAVIIDADESEVDDRGPVASVDGDLIE